MSKTQLPSSIAPSLINTYVDHMVTSLSAAILDGSIRPGTRLIETELAERFGVSRAPVRHALLRLESDGLIKVTPYRGAVVRQLHGEDVIEVYVLRSSLGVLAIRKLISDNLVDDVADELTKLEKVMHNPAVVKSQQKTIDADLAFQSAIIDATGLERTKEQFAELTSEVRLFILTTKIQYPVQGEIGNSNAELLAAILDKNAERAVALWRNRMKKAVEEFLSLIPDGKDLSAKSPWIWDLL